MYKTFAEIQAANAAKENMKSAPKEPVQANIKEESFDFSKFDDIDTDSDSDMEADIHNDDIDEESEDEVPEEDEVVYVPEPRTSAKVNFGFTPRLFPTPARESKQSK